MRIVTWNINSIRIRLENLARLNKEVEPDIICLQETKVIDSLFPYNEVKSLGFDYIEISGEKGYNGVAILSKLPLKNIEYIKFAHDTACRHISAIIGDGIELHNLYVPAGGDIPDAKLNDKFAYKLEFMDELHKWFLSKKPSDKIIIVGDLNIAPLEHDVWSHKQLLSVVSHTPIEVEKMNILQAGLNWIDVPRKFVANNQKLYSWWSYRNRDWKKSDRGRRLDHIWVTPALANNIHNSYILRDARDWPNPSDHVPVIGEFKL
jgi:exodeoxyribonuclease-3